MLRKSGVYSFTFINIFLQSLTCLAIDKSTKRSYLCIIFNSEANIYNSVENNKY